MSELPEASPTGAKAQGPSPAAPQPSTPSPKADATPRVDGRPTVRVRLVRNGRALDCDSAGMVLRHGEKVVVDDRRTMGLGVVTLPTGVRPVRNVQGRIVRRAEARDLTRAEQEQKRQQDALGFARERARGLGLPIKLFRADIAAGSDKALFFFSCDQRVDFRALVRDLAAYLHMRIELRQVGVRDESKLTGGIGSCGRELCCSTHLNHFAPVSIKMAKHQRLVLNPTKIAGQCGRLKCCLVYEDDLYVEMSKGLPKPGKKVETPEGIGRVDDLDVLGGRVRVAFLERPPMTFLASEVRVLQQPPEAAGPPSRPSSNARSAGQPDGMVQAHVDDPSSGEIDDSGAPMLVDEEPEPTSS